MTFFVLIFMKFTAAEQHCVQISISPMRDYKLCARTGRNLFTSVSKIWFSLLPFSRNTQSLHIVCVHLLYLFFSDLDEKWTTYRSLVPRITQTGKEIWKSQVQILLCP